MELETENLETAKQKFLAVAVIQFSFLGIPVLFHLQFLPSPTAPSCSVMCDCLVFLTWIIVYVLSIILSLVFHT